MTQFANTNQTFVSFRMPQRDGTGFYKLDIPEPFININWSVDDKVKKFSLKISCADRKIFKNFLNYDFMPHVITFLVTVEDNGKKLCKNARCIFNQVYTSREEAYIVLNSVEEPAIVTYKGAMDSYQSLLADFESLSRDRTILYNDIFELGKAIDFLFVKIKREDYMPTIIDHIEHINKKLDEIKPKA